MAGHLRERITAPIATSFSINEKYFMDSRTNEDFTQHLMDAVREAEALGYEPKRFKAMLRGDGGFDTVKSILEAGKPSEGFTRLWELNRLDLTCEAIIVQSKWRPYFDVDLVARAERLLRQSGFACTPYVGESANQTSPRARSSEPTFPAPDFAVTNAPTISTAAPGTDGNIKEDLQELAASTTDSTTRAALIDARLGQGGFRKALLKTWDGACAVTVCRLEAILRASHCKPWRESDNAERLDSNNGLLLVANLDALFDAGLISFDSSGEMLVADAVASHEKQTLGLSSGLTRTPGRRLEHYLAYHRRHVFLRL